jgi:TPP-dependent trihydroxycyclohexane-1,2-dione (THcHDO) dehydratase
VYYIAYSENAPILLFIPTRPVDFATNAKVLYKKDLEIYKLEIDCYKVEDYKYTKE